MNTLMIFVAQYLILLAPIIIIIIYIWTHDKKKEAIIDSVYMAIASAIAWGIAHILKNTFKTLRPELANDILLKSESVYAFPSGHTTFFFALATVLYFHHKRLAYVTYVIGLAVGMARVYIGVHYPIDIIGGIVLGILVGVASKYIYDIIKKYGRK